MGAAASKSAKFACGARELFAFYRRGAVVDLPRREADVSRWRDRVLVAVHGVVTAYALGLVAARALGSWRTAVVTLVFVVLGHLAVDVVNGLVHFALDNYFRRDTPILGVVVGNFLDHHRDPAAISRIHFARNVSALVALSLPVMAALVVVRPSSLVGVALSSFGALFFAETAFSLEAHKYAHIDERSLPAAVRWLQRRGWLVSHDVHRAHHRSGHASHYASVTGRSNRWLTAAFHRRLERALHGLTRRIVGAGVEPRSWRDAAVRSAALDGERA